MQSKEVNNSEYNIIHGSITSSPSDEERGFTVILEDGSRWDEEADIADNGHLAIEKRCLLVPMARYKPVYEMWLQHLSCFWTPFEHDPSADRAKFSACCDEKLQEITLKMIVVLFFGDDQVVDQITDGLSHKITQTETKVMLTDQAARENVHRAVYSRMLQVCAINSKHSPEYYQRASTIQEITEPLTACTEKWQECAKSIHLQFYCMMMFEMIIFSPMFQTICYIATKGLAPHLTSSNVMVMRDEFIHYKHARWQLFNMERKINHKLACQILCDFATATAETARRIIGDYVSDDGKFSYRTVFMHLMWIVRKFADENGLFQDRPNNGAENEQKAKKAKLDDTNTDSASIDGNNIEKETNALIDKLIQRAPSTITMDEIYYLTIDDPASEYMSMPQFALKYNLMEANSTVYSQPTTGEEINMAW